MKARNHLVAKLFGDKQNSPKTLRNPHQYTANKEVAVMPIHDTYDDVQASYGRCLRKKGFITRFYEILMQSHTDMEPMFHRTDFGQQRKALRRGISIAISFAAGSPSAQYSMDQMAEIHSRIGRAPVDPALYRFWLDSLIQALSETDPRFNDQVEARWHEAMQKTIDYFSKAFTESVTRKTA